MYYRATGKPKAGTKGRKAAENAPSGVLSPEAQMWRGLALTKKKHLRIRIPQRQFIGQSRELEERIRTDVETQVEAVLKLLGRNVSTVVHARWRKLHHHQVHTKGRRRPFRSARQPQPTPFTKRDSSRLDPRAGISKGECKVQHDGIKVFSRTFFKQQTAAT